MKKIKYSEIFYSLQGEGMFIGTPSVFLRTFGCNFTCSGFGMKKGELSKERENISVSEDLPLKSLPLVETGCDSYVSWDPRFKKYAKEEPLEEIAKKLLAATPDKSWQAKDGSDIHFIITGGEPLLGWQKAYADLLEQAELREIKNLTFETNATQKLDPQFKDYLNTQFSKRAKVTWACSPKLSNSGHSAEEAIKPEILKSYSEINNSEVFLKFVVNEISDFDEVEQTILKFREQQINPKVYIMPVGGTAEGYLKNRNQIADETLRRGYRFSPRLHVELWRNAWGK